MGNQRKNVKTSASVKVITKPETEEEKKENQQENPAPKQQPENTGTESEKKTAETGKVYKKKFFFQSPIGIKKVEVVKEQKAEESKETPNEEEKPTFKSRFRKFMNGLGTVALVTGVGLAAYGDYKMKKAMELEEEDEDEEHPPEDEEDCDENDPESEEDDEDEEDD